MVVKTQRVEVPVYQKLTAPEVLKQCGHQKPGFRFGTNKNGDAVVPPKDQPALRNWIDEKQRCVEAWQEWNR